MTDANRPASEDKDQERDALIHEVALTNQIIVPWEDLRKALKEKLEVAIKSAGLIYTDPFITNPITTTLAAENTSIPDLSELSAVPVVVPDVTQDEPAQEAPKQEQEQGQEKVTTEAAEAATTPTEAAKEEETTTTTTDTTSITPVDDKVEVTAPTVSSNGPATPPRMVPVSKETLILETPAGYHARINQLLNTFTSAPFTIQRVCELLDNPTEHHSSLIKYLRAVEKVLMITSSIGEFSNPAYSGPSALDGDLASENKASSSNGLRHTLDMSLIVTAAVGQENEEEEEEEHQEEGFTSARSTETEEAPADAQAQEAEEMDVEKPDETDMDVDTEGTSSELRENMDVDSA